MYFQLDLLLLLQLHRHHLGLGLAQSSYHPVQLQHLLCYRPDKLRLLLNQVLLYL
ncbi:hypothetical protein D3C81_1795820 [compost metagenome]